MNSNAPDSFGSGADIAAGVKNACIEDETEQSHIDYTTSVIAGWTLLDVRDGLKPVHRRILYAMHQTDVTSNLLYRKSSSIVGETMGDHHSHGDSAVYDTLACMAQDFSMRYPLVDGQSNFGPVDGGPPATMRYTEVRMSPIAEGLLDDIDENTADFQSNYDDHKQELTVLPPSFPNLLVNGSSGIAAGIPTNIPPHNLGEIVDATVEFIEDPDAVVANLMEYTKGPDSPTGADIVGRNAVHKAYKTGRGRVRVRADYDAFEEEGRIVVNELPYQENKTRLIEHIADDVNEGKIESIRDIRDKSDRDGIHIVTELKRGAVAKVIKDQLLGNHLEPTFGVINLALVNGQPQMLTLKEMLEHYLDHRRNVVRRHFEYELAETGDRAHILDGRLKAFDNIDGMVEAIRNSKSHDDVKVMLRGEVEVEVGGGPLSTFNSSEEQTSHAVSVQLGPLTSMGAVETKAEYEGVQATIECLETILSDQSELDAVIESKLLGIKGEYVDDRQTSFVASADEITRADFIPEKGAVIVVNEDNYIRRMPVSWFHDQYCGGKGIIGMDLKEGDNVSSVLVTNTRDDLLCLTNHGQIYQLKIYQIPEMSQTTRGKSAVNLLDLDDGEEITAVADCDDLEDIEGYLTMVTRNGYTKRIGIDHFQNILSTDVVATKLDEGDELVDAEVMGDGDDLVISTEREMSIRFDEDEVRVMGCSTRDVRGIKLEDDDVVVGVAVIDEDHHSRILTVAENGYRERTDLDIYRTRSRNDKDLIGIKVNEQDGPVCAISIVGEDDYFVVMSDEGQTLRTPIEDISMIGCDTMGIVVTDLGEDDDVASVDVILTAVTTEDEELGGADSVEGDAEIDAKVDVKADVDDE